MSSTYSLSFDGTGYVDVPGVPDQGGGTFSVSLWVKGTDSTGGHTVISKFGGGGSTGWLLYNGNGSHLSLDLEQGPGRQLDIDSSVIYDGNWHNVLAVAVWSGSAYTSLSIYVDGTIAGSWSGSFGFSAATTAHIVLAGRDGGGSLWNGKLDDVAIWSVDQSAHAAGLAAGSTDPSTLATGLVGLWRLEEGTGTTTADTSGNGNTGTLTGGVTWSSDVPSQLAASGSVGTATGTSTAAGVGASLAAAVGAVVGISTAAAVGKSLAAATGASSGTGSAAAIGASLAAAVGSSSGIGTAAGIGASLAAATSTISGIGTAAGAGASLAAAVGAADGTATVAGFSPGGSTGTAAGSATCAGVSASLAAAVGTATGTCTVVGIAPGGAVVAGPYYFTTAALYVAGASAGLVYAAGASVGQITTE